MRRVIARGYRWRKALTLSRKVSLAVIVVVSSLIGFFLFEGIREQKILLADAARKEAESQAMLLRASLEDPRLWESEATLQAFVQRVAPPRAESPSSPTWSSRDPDGREILILGPDRMVLAGSVRNQVGARYSRDLAGEIGLTMTDGKMREFREVGPSLSVWVAVPLDVGHARKGILLFKPPYAAAAGRAHDLAVQVSREALLIAIPALLFVIWMTRRYLLKPIHLLKEGASAWKRGELSHRVAFSGTDELGQLRDAFNDMATAIQGQHAALEQKQAELEESLRRNQEAQAHLIQSEKLASIGTLAAGVAHELNQPLMLIRGYAQRLLSGKNDVSSQARKDIEIIEEETSRMTMIIRHLKDFSRKSGGEYQEVDLNAIVQRSCALLAEEFRLRKIEVRLTLDQALPRIWGDPIQLTQIIINLITNARDALDEVEGGVLTVQSYRREDGSVGVSFVDTGRGIDPEILPRIFDPFFTTKTVGSGTGLGLSIALGLVQAHGGELNASSEPGHGAQFTVTLPAGGKP